MSSRTARRVSVSGRVQGVFFRDSCRQQAQDAGVSGWVSNADDGTVQALFEGAAADVERLVAWVHQGPSGAHVDHIDVRDAEPEGLSGFEVR